MKVEFVKMNGAANDFIMVDNRRGNIRLPGPVVAALCDRRRGVGADGLILVEPSDGYDFFMHYYNADGGEEVMCGNGARCSAHFAARLGLGRGEGGDTTLHFLTGSGSIDARVAGRDVTMSMMDAREMRRNVRTQVAPEGATVHFMVVGTRHAVVPLPDVSVLTAEDIVRYGRALRYDPAFAPGGANVNFASLAADGRMHLRTYEKGIEGETLACGTGSVASAVIFASDGLVKSPVCVVQHSGDELIIEFEPGPEGAHHVRMRGPVSVNFQGSIDVDV
ncbi:MAG TPA: diaminopimelate epimerase [Candidatus Krumholzibacteria bacterium]|nr:diaminopimelate epimerase [Candidatus Krumholzibacteria bacterium]